MTAMTFLMILTMVMSSIFAAAAHILPARMPDKDKTSPYECGFDPMKSARLPFSFRFFLVAMLFLLFDLEMALLFPLPAALTISDPSTFLVVSATFMTILTLGLVFEWVKGGLEWAE